MMKVEHFCDNCKKQVKEAGNLTEMFIGQGGTFSPMYGVPPVKKSETTVQGAFYKRQSLDICDECKAKVNAYMDPKKAIDLYKQEHPEQKNVEPSPLDLFIAAMEAIGYRRAE